MSVGAELPVTQVSGGEKDPFAASHGDFEVLVAVVPDPLRYGIAMNRGKAGDRQEDSSDGSEDAVDEGFAFLHRLLR